MTIPDAAKIARYDDLANLVEELHDENMRLRAALKIAHENLEDTAHLVEIDAGKDKVLRSLATKARHAVDALKVGAGGTVEDAA